MTARSDRWIVPSDELVQRLVDECRDLGHSPTLEQWDAAMRPILEAAAADPAEPQRAQEASVVLAAWRAAITLVNARWEQAHQAERETQDQPPESDHDPGKPGPDLDEDWRR